MAELIEILVINVEVTFLERKNGRQILFNLSTRRNFSNNNFFMPGKTFHIERDEGNQVPRAFQR
jgi:hypothetical protein